MRISNSVNNLDSVEPLEPLAKSTSSAAPIETRPSENSQAELGGSEVSSAKLPTRPADDPLAKAFLLQKLEAAGTQASALSSWKEGKSSGALITDPTVGGASDENAGGQESEFAARLAQELQNAGISVNPDDLSDLSNAITKGGQGAMALALMLVTSIAEAHVEPSNEIDVTSGDPTQPPNEGNTASSTPQFQISQTQSDQFSAALSSSENDSSSQLSQLLLSELNRLKKK